MLLTLESGTRFYSSWRLKPSTKSSKKTERETFENAGPFCNINFQKILLSTFCSAKKHLHTPNSPRLSCHIFCGILQNIKHQIFFKKKKTKRTVFVRQISVSNIQNSMLRQVEPSWQLTDKCGAKYMVKRYFCRPKCKGRNSDPW